MKFPALYRVNQKFDVTSLPNVAESVHEAFAQFDPAGKIRPGQTVAVAVGSRGTHDLKDLVTATVACLKSIQLKPFIIPAMGSHGGGTAEGQRQVLAELGITENSVGAPVVPAYSVATIWSPDPSQAAANDCTCSAETSTWSASRITTASAVC